MTTPQPLTRVSGGLIVPGTIGAAHIADGAVTGAKLAAGAAMAGTQDGGVALAKLATAIKPEVLINTFTVSAAAQLDITGFDPALYRSYRIELERVFPATNAPLQIRTSTDGGATFDAGANDYRVHSVGAVAAVGPAGWNQNGASQINITLNYSLQTNADESWNGEIVLPNPAAAQRCFLLFRGMFVNNGAHGGFVDGAGMRLASADVNAVRIMANTGNVSGTARLFGTRI